MARQLSTFVLLLLGVPLIICGELFPKITPRQTAFIDPLKVEPRCNKYKVLPYDPSIFDCSEPYNVAASSISGTVISWDEPDTVVCDSTFTVGAQCCGLCTFIQFFPNNDYTELFSLYMVETAFNECYGQYDTTTSVVTPAYANPTKSVYRVFRNQNYNKWLKSLDQADANLIDAQKYRSSPFKYSFGVILAQDGVLVLVFCNNFDRLTYNGTPNVLVLSKDAYLSKEVRQLIHQTLRDNNIDPDSLCFRNNYNCASIEPFDPDWYLNPKRPQPLLKEGAVKN